MDYKKRFLLNDLVKGQRTFNNEVVEGRFNGFHLHNKLDPTSVVGVICVEGDRCYDVVPGSIELLESKDEGIRSVILKALMTDEAINILVECGIYYEDVESWLEKQCELIDKLVIYREWLISKSEWWTEKENDKTNSNAGKHYCIGGANALISARAEFEEIFDYGSWLEKQGEILKSIKHKEAMLDCQTCANYKNECFPDRNIFKCSYPIKCSAQDIDGKQEEKKPTDNVNKKFGFAVGDWIVNNKSKNVFFIKSITNGYCSLEDTKGDTHSPCLPFESDFHLWTIEDAKGGDVLSDGTIVLIVDSIEDFEGIPIINSWYFVDSEKFYGKGTSEPDMWEVEGFTPATKEQRDLLFQKMKEAGYEWDAGKKELKKIEQKPAEQGEDEQHRKWILEYLYDGLRKSDEQFKDQFQCAISWLEKQEEKKSAEWSRQSIIDALTKWLNEKITPLHKKSLDGTLTEREDMFETALVEMRSFVNGPHFQIGEDTSAKWSEEDEKISDAIYQSIDFLVLKDFGITEDDVVDWLKSSKEKHTWKPSDEQMEALKDAVGLYKSTHFDSQHYKIESLYNKLKKLMEE